jgi:hypothetical protein
LSHTDYEKNPQITNIGNKKGNVTASPTDIKIAVRENAEDYFTNKFDDSSETNKFLEEYTIISLTKKYITL